jgi:predicted helicase
MANDQKLLNVNDFESLIEYLRYELDWDFQTEDIEDLAFDYDPETELGLDQATAAKIESIRQIRPLTTNQEWGIFYIDFEPKNLPIVVLRRILSKLVVKRRKSANKADRAAWEPHDLLFIASYGEDQTRTMSFAHFADSSEFGDLPTLKTITWNKLDTPLHLQHAHDTLKTKLRFPDNPNDAEAWRKQWASAFTQRHGEVVRTSKQLAIRLAELADSIRKRANEILHLENEKGELRKLHQAFQEALIHDLSYDDFADMYAQTISYGLLTAKISRPAGLVADNIADMVPVTNPFLKELLQTFLVVGGRGNLIDFDELGINDVVEMLRKADMEAVLRDFGDRNPTEDPAIHFYELFLKEYDPEKRMKRGVFYTPKPVVSFIVRSVHEILQKEFGLVDGLADTTTWGEMKSRNKDLEIPKGVKETAPFVQILDPATGTGTFLVEVIKVIHHTLEQKWQREGKSKAQQIKEWNDYVPKNLLPRLYGFELMMAPYSIAHMKIGLILKETDYKFLSSERAQIYLTNTLEEPKDFSDYFATMSPALAHEAEAANRVKRQTPITIVVGNPPYSGVSENRSDFITDLIKAYRSINDEALNETKVWLKDDYVKFIRWSEHQLNKVNFKILAFITNNSFYDGLTFRGMRHHLIKTFPNAKLIDLHGNSKLKEKDFDGGNDENVFDIMQGVGISFFFNNEKSKEILTADLFGLRENKYKSLANSTASKLTNEEIDFKPKNFFFKNIGKNTDESYHGFSSMNKAMIVGGLGMQSHRDNFVVAFSREELRQRMKEFFDLSISDEKIAEKFNIRDFRRFSITRFRRENSFQEKTIQRISYRPFDDRWIYYAKDIVQEWQINFHGHMLKPNLALNIMRQTKSPEWRHALVSKFPTPAVYVEIKDGSSLYPLYLYPTEREKALGATERVPNFSDEFIKEFSNKLGLEFVYDDEIGDAKQDTDTFTPEDVFGYAYAVFHSPTYRARYAEFLKIDFPRLPLTTDRDLFRKLCAQGAKLVALHLLESVDAPPDWNLKTEGAFLFQNTIVAAGFPKKDLAEIDKTGKGKVYINRTTYFDGVPEPVWNFHIGGYQVCHKWLKDRKDRTLSTEDIAHYGKIVVALGETIRLMAEIDEVIEEHGGFPLVGSQDGTPKIEKGQTSLPFA